MPNSCTRETPPVPIRFVTHARGELCLPAGDDNNNSAAQMQAAAVTHCSNRHLRRGMALNSCCCFVAPTNFTLQSNPINALNIN